MGPSVLFSFFVPLQKKKQLLYPGAEFVLSYYTLSLSGTCQGFAVSHTFLGNMADLLTWRGVHPCHLITGRIPILKRQRPDARETDGERGRQWEREIKNGKKSLDRWWMHDRWAMQGNTFILGAVLHRLKLAPLHWSDKPYVHLKALIHFIYNVLCTFYHMQRGVYIFKFLAWDYW